MASKSEYCWIHSSGLVCDPMCGLEKDGVVRGQGERLHCPKIAHLSEEKMSKQGSPHHTVSLIKHLYD